jgi:hypothetical protein
VYRENTRETINGDNVCESCIDSNYVRCENCGQYIRSENEFESDDGDSLCRTCYREANPVSRFFHAYHGFSDEVRGFFSYTDDGNITNERNYDISYIGLEWEMDKGRRNDFIHSVINESYFERNEDLFHFEKDGSLSAAHGLELITSPMSYGFLQKFDIEGIAQKAIKCGFRGHNNTNAGLHIHLGIEAFGNTQAEKQMILSSVVYILEKFRNEEIFRISRRDASSFDRYACTYYLNDMDNVSYREIHRKTDHFKILNITGDTVELRMFKSTMLASSIRAAVDFYLGIIAVSKMFSFRTLKRMSFDHIRGVIENNNDVLRAYLEKRLGTTVDSEAMVLDIIRIQDELYGEQCAIEEQYFDGFLQGYQMISPIYITRCRYAGHLNADLSEYEEISAVLPIPAILGDD